MNSRDKAISRTRVLVPLGLGTALSLAGDATLYTVLPTQTAQAGVALASVGILLSANRAVRVLLNGPAGWVYDRVPRRPLFVCSLFIGALSTAIYAATRGFWPLLIGRLLWGLAWSGIWVGGATMIVDITTVQNRGRYTGAYQAWFALGAGLCALLGGLLTDQLGYTMTMWVGAAVTGMGGIVALLFLPETRYQRREAAIVPDQIDTPSTATRRGMQGAIVLHGINRFITAGVFSATAGLLVEAQLQMPGLGLGVATITGLLGVTRTLLGLTTTPLVGRISDWLGNRWRVLAWMLALGAAGMISVALPTPVMILAGIILLAAAGGGVQTLVTALAGDLAPAGRQGRAIGALHTAGDLGSALGPLAAYALLPTLGLSGTYLLCAVLFIVGLGLLSLAQGGGTMSQSYPLEREDPPDS